MVALAMSACGDGSASLPPVADASIAADAPPGPTDAAVVADAGPASFPGPCADVYDPDQVVRFDVEFDEATWQALLADRANLAQTYHPIVFRYGDEPAITDAMIRLKGNPYALQAWDKMQFVVSFNETNPAGRFHGLRKVNLDHAPYDPTLLRPRVGFDYFADLGVPSSCANTAELYFNGALYGVFSNIEVVNKDFLDRNFADDDGNLYKYGRIKETNEDDLDTSDVDAFWAATTVDELAATADVEQLVAFWAAEAALPFGDGWWGHNRNNFFLYHTVDRGFIALPWDPDFALDVDTYAADPLTYDFPWDQGVTPRPDPWYVVVAEPAWCDRFLTGLETALAAYDAPGRAAQVQAWATQIRPSVAQDPFVDLADHDGRVQGLRDFLGLRADYLAAWLADRRALPLDGDADGVATCRDCDDGDPAVGACPIPPFPPQ